MQRDKSSTTIVFEALLGGWLRCGLRVSALKMECLDAVADSVSFDDLNGVQRLNSLERLEQMCAGFDQVCLGIDPEPDIDDVAQRKIGSVRAVPAASADGIAHAIDWDA